MTSEPTRGASTRVAGRAALLVRRALTWPWVIVIVIVIAAVVVVPIALSGLDDCAPAVDRADSGQCVGVSGSYAFDDAFKPAMERIDSENRQVQERAETAAEESGGEAQDAFVTLAYVLPVPARANGLTRTQRHELEGAAIAQSQANSGNSMRGDRPLIKLVVANAGENGAHAADVGLLLRAYPKSERLVAALGFDISVRAIEDSVRALALPKGDRIPVVLSMVTADGFAGTTAQDRLDAVVRVAPTNSDQAGAAVAALGAGPFRALVVQDTNADDTYARTLGDEFARALGDPGDARTLLRTETYDSTDPRRVAGRLNEVVDELCTSRPDIVYFAGRAAHLQDLLGAVPNPRCGDFTLNIWTGDDAVNRARQPLPAGVTLHHTALAHPGVWPQPARFTPDRLLGPCAEAQRCFAATFGYADDGRDELSDGGAILGHDTVRTAVWAVRTDPNTVVDREAVVSAFQGLHGVASVPGASGWISFNEAGNPERKAIPVLEVDGAGIARPVAENSVAAAGGPPYEPPR